MMGDRGMGVPWWVIGELEYLGGVIGEWGYLGG